MTRFKDRSTSEILVLMIAGTLCGSVIAGTILILILAIIHPDHEYNEGARTVADLLTTMIGLLAGYLAGRTELDKRSKGPSAEELYPEIDLDPPEEPVGPDRSTDA